MEEQVKTAVEAITGAESTEASIEVYLAMPKALRREVFAKLPAGDMKKKVRAAVEKRRGIAARTTAGDLVLTRDVAIEQILRLVRKQQLMDERKATLEQRVVELKNNAQELYGSDFIAEVEIAIEQI